MEIVKKIPTGYKKVEIGIIPEDWDSQNIVYNSTLKARIGWQGLTTKEYLKSGDYVLITGTDFSNGRIDWDNCWFVEKERYQQDINIQIKDGDILITKDGTIGKIAYVEGMKKYTTLNSGIFVIRSKAKEYVSKFLYYIFNSFYFKDFLRKLKAGSTISHLYQKDFINFNFAIPSLPEQKAISDVFSDVDELIMSINRLIDKKKNVKYGTMQELLTGENRLPEFSDKWEVKAINSLVEFRNGKAHENSIVANGKYVVVNSKFISTEGKIVKKSQECFCSANEKDTLMVMSDIPNGKAIAKCYYVQSDDKYTVNQRICILRPKFIDSKFLFYKVNRHPYYLSLDDGVKQTNLRREDVLNCSIYIPNDLKEQMAIAQILTDMDTEIEQLEAKLNKIKKMKQGMMQELLTGRIRLIKPKLIKSS